MPQQVFEKIPDVQPVKVPGATPQVKGHALPFRGHPQRADGGDPILLVHISDNRCFPSRSPSAGNVGNEEKTALIEKHQMGANFFGVFLYGASGTASNARSPLRSVAGHGAPASGNSTPKRSGVSRHDRDDTKPRNLFRSPRPPAARSKDPSCTRRPEAPSEALSRVFPSGVRIVGAVGPAWVEARVRGLLPFGKLDTIGAPNSPTRSTRAPLPTNSFLASAVGSLVGAASPTAVRFLVVCSCIIVYTKRRQLSIIYAKLNNTPNFFVFYEEFRNSL